MHYLQIRRLKRRRLLAKRQKKAEESYKEFRATLDSWNEGHALARVLVDRLLGQYFRPTMY